MEDFSVQARHYSAPRLKVHLAAVRSCVQAGVSAHNENVMLYGAMWGKTDRRHLSKCLATLSSKVNRIKIKARPLIVKYFSSPAAMEPCKVVNHVLRAMAA